MRLAPLAAAALAACNDCTLLGGAEWEVALWDLPDDADVIAVTTWDGFDERRCRVRLEPPETRGDWGPGPSEPDLAEEDCPDASWVYTSLGSLRVRNPAPRRFSWGEVTVEHTLLDGETTGFDTGLHPDWGLDPLATSPWCTAGSLAVAHLDAATGAPVSPP